MYRLIPVLAFVVAAANCPRASAAAASDCVASGLKQGLGTSPENSALHRELWNLLRQPNLSGAKLIEMLSRHPELKIAEPKEEPDPNIRGSRQRIAKLYEVFDEKQSDVRLNSIHTPTKIDIPNLARAAVALHEIAKAEAPETDERALAKMADLMGRIGFNGPETAIAKAVSDTAALRALIEEKISAEQAYRQLTGLATHTPLKPKDFFKLQSFFLSIEATCDLAAQKKYLFKTSKGTFEIWGSGYQRLQKLFQTGLSGVDPILESKRRAAERSERKRSETHSERVLASGHPEILDPFYYIRGSAETPTPELLDRRLAALLNASGSDPGQKHFKETQPGIFKVYAAGKSLVAAGDLVVDEPGLARDNLRAKAYRFKAGSDQIVASYPVSVPMIEKLQADPVTLIRKMSPEEWRAWKSGATETLRSYSGYPAGLKDANLRWFNGQGMHFSVGIPVFHRVSGTRMVTLSIPKAKLLEWAVEGKAVAGNLRQDMIEIVVVDPAWEELAPYFQK